MAEGESRGSATLALLEGCRVGMTFTWSEIKFAHIIRVFFVLFILGGGGHRGLKIVVWGGEAAFFVEFSRDRQVKQK